MKLSIIIPAHNEEGNIQKTVRAITILLAQKKIPHEIIIVNDNSSDGTQTELDALKAEFPRIVTSINNPPPNGFGLAVQKGLQHFSGDAVVIVMADGSDEPEDIVQYYSQLQKGYECVFGSRFTKESKVIDYPIHKLVLNRLANWFIKVLFRINYNDVTNAFKCYRADVIKGISPILSHHFNLTVELPLKAIVRGYTYSVVPTNWYNRTSGISKLKIKEMGSRYLFIILYMILEKWLSKGDYEKGGLIQKEGKPVLDENPPERNKCQ